MNEKIKDGLHTEWYDNGHKKEEGTYKDGKKDGLWTGWYENGQKKSEGTYKDGKRISSKEWNEDGSVKE